MRMRALIVAILAALTLAAGCSSPDPDDVVRGKGRPVPSDNTTTSAAKQGGGPAERTEPADPLLQEATDAGLEESYLSCVAGDLDACDAVYLGAPVGSDLEAFGDSCGNRQPEGEWCGEVFNQTPEPAPAVDDREIFRAAMEVTIDALDPATIAEMCDGIDTFGMELAIDSLRQGFGEEGFHEDIAVEILTERCA
jgi:hypothetical protein